MPLFLALCTSLSFYTHSRASIRLRGLSTGSFWTSGRLRTWAGCVSYACTGGPAAYPHSRDFLPVPHAAPAASLLRAHAPPLTPCAAYSQPLPASCHRAAAFSALPHAAHISLHRHGASSAASRTACTALALLPAAPLRCCAVKRGHNAALPKALCGARVRTGRRRVRSARHSSAP